MKEALLVSLLSLFYFAAHFASATSSPALVSANSGSPKQGVQHNSSNSRQAYTFQLAKGDSVPVCGAYLIRLNLTDYEKPPYCDRPENNAVDGFALLNRVGLSPIEIHDLYPIIWTFMLSANQTNLDWASLDLQHGLTESGQFVLSQSDSKYVQMYLDRGEAKIWRYNPPVDIDNDGAPDDVEIWHGIALPTGIGGRQCGADFSDKFPGDQLLHQPQVPFVTRDRGDRLDVIKTKKIFAHPKGGYAIQVDGKWTVADRFRPVGSYIGIFKYLDTYYFDTFFDGWGDAENNRQTENTRRKNKQITNTLAVFVHKDGKTRQICEYLMTDNLHSAK